MGQTHSLLLPAGALLALVAYLLYTQLYLPAHGPRITPGPASEHWFYGNMRQSPEERSEMEIRLVAEYGPVLSFFGPGNRPRLLTTDVRAIAHVLQRADIYQKPAHTQRALAQTLGAGLLVAEGDAHRMQRKALNPAFGPSQIRDLTGIMLDKANELRDVLSALVGPRDMLEVNIEVHLSRCTLDIIGLAGFGYDFAALSSGENELAAAFDTIFGAAQAPGFLDMLAMLVPGFRHVPTARNRRIASAMRVMRRIGTGLIADRKADALLEAAQGEKLANSRARDILSLLVRANTAADARQRLSDEDILAQIPTFLVAGHETTSTLLSWILFALAQRPDVQATLRAECRAHPLPTAPRGNDPLDVDELTALDRLPLLDAVVRETLRLHAPVPGTGRAATCDDVLPLATPFTDRAGVQRMSVPVRKGDVVLVPIRLVNRAPAIWGADADQWRPERWTDGSVGEKTKSMPGVWGNVLSFLGGSHACIGYKFSLYEAKMMLHVLMCDFEVKLAVPVADVGATRGITSRPFVKSRREEGGQLPVFLRRVGAHE